jgi:hypothetical protein
MYDEGYQIAVCEHHYGDDFANADSNGRINVLGIAAFPTLMPDGLPEPSYPYSHSILENCINDRLAADAPCTLELSGSLDDNNLSLTVGIQKDDGAAMPNPRVQVVITETEIPYSGAGYTTMNFVTRDMIPTHLGTDITMQGNTHQLQVDATLDPSWNQDHIILVAWVEDGSNHHVFQTIRVNLADLGSGYEAPANLQGVINGTDAELTWDAPSTPPNGYKVYRDGAFVEELDASILTYTDPITAIGDVVYYVTAVYTEGESGPSNEVTLSFVPTPEPPLNLAAQVNGHEVSLTWDAANIFATAYRVYRSNEFVGEVAEPGFTETVSGAGNYVYFVTAMYDAVESMPSNMVTVDVTAAGNGVSVSALQLAVHPNPFNPSASIAYSVPVAGEVSLTIYNVQGRVVKHLLDATMPAGTYQASWDGTDANGAAQPSGVYLLRLRTSSGTQARKMLMLK